MVAVTDTDTDTDTDNDNDTDTNTNTNTNTDTDEALSGSVVTIWRYYYMSPNTAAYGIFGYY